MISKGGILSEHCTLMLCTVGYDDSIAMYRNGLSGCTSRAGGGVVSASSGTKPINDCWLAASSPGMAWLFKTHFASHPS